MIYDRCDDDAVVTAAADDDDGVSSVSVSHHY